MSKLSQNDERCFVPLHLTGNRMKEGIQSFCVALFSCFYTAVKSEKHFSFTNPSTAVAANSFLRQAAPQDLQVAAGLVSETVRRPGYRRVGMTFCCPIV